jgi:type III secretion protein T
LDADLIAEGLSDYALTTGLAAMRIAVAFVMLPIFSKELIPPLIRGAIFISFAFIVTVLQEPIDFSLFDTSAWIATIAKEVYIGIAIGIFFGLFLWCFEAAGQIVDTQIGLTMAQIYDPIEGHQTSLVGLFLSRVANYVFIVSGGLGLLVATLFESYALWPIASMTPIINSDGLELFKMEFQSFFVLMVMVASPFLVVLFLIDATMGLINREASQFNVYFLSIPIKMLASTFVLILSISLVSTLLIEHLADHAGSVLHLLEKMLGGV